MRTLLRLATVTVLATGVLSAQASFQSYGSVCNGAKALNVTGLPKLGTTFQVHGVVFGPFTLCTRRLCAGPCQRCNSCNGVYGYLTIGIRRISAPLTPTCNLLDSAELIISGTTTGTLSYPVPNNAGLIGQKFYMQRGDVRIAQWMGSNCPSHFRPDSIVSMSDGVEGTIGL